jgi:DNA-directed RNA polymerase specialized sigma24 family protein
MPKFHGLVEQEIPRLRRYARALMRHAQRADDLVQDTLVRALTKGHLWQPGTDIRAWLFIMHNQFVNTVRRDMRGQLRGTTRPKAALTICVARALVGRA